MNKGLFSFFLIFIALFVGALYFTNNIQGPLITALNYIKSNYHNSTTFVQNTIDEHIFQTNQIKYLREKLEKYDNQALEMLEVKSQLNNMIELNNSKLKVNPIVELVRTISYQKFGDLNRVWIDIDDYNSSKIYGLIYHNYVAGIVISSDEKALGLLNRDFQSSYAVYVGSKKAPGIVHGNNTQNLLVKFIPAWFNIKAGDEVISSGLDNIFFQGLKVGRVLSVSKSQGYQNAVIEPYYKTNNPKYFHMIRRVK